MFSLDINRTSIKHNKNNILTLMEKMKKSFEYMVSSDAILNKYNSNISDYSDKLDTKNNVNARYYLQFSGFPIHLQKENFEDEIWNSRKTFFNKSGLESKVKYNKIFIESNPITFIPNVLRVSIGHFIFNESIELKDNKFCSERWKYLKKIYNFKVKPMRKDGEHILFLLQSTKQYFLKGENFESIINESISKIRKFSNRKIILRYKPGCGEKFNIKDSESNIVISMNKNLKDDLKNAWITVSHSTLASVTAIINGVPHIALSKYSLPYSVSDHDLSKIENPTIFDRTNFFNKLSINVWSVEELIDGTYWRFYFDHLNNFKKYF